MYAREKGTALLSIGQVMLRFCRRQWHVATGMGRSGGDGVVGHAHGRSVVGSVADHHHGVTESLITVHDGSLVYHPYRAAYMPGSDGA